MVEATITEEDKKNLKALVDEVPRLRLLIEELIETLDILGDKELMKSVRAGQKDVTEGRLLDYKGLLTELGLDEKEI